MRSRHLVPIIGLMTFIATGCDAPQAASRPETLVRVQTVALADYVETLSLTGAVHARAETAVAFLVSGQLVELAVDVGTAVKTGDMLARLAPKEQQADVDSAHASLGAAQAQLVQAEAAFKRQSKLWNQGFITRTAYDDARTSLETATNARNAAQAQLKAAEEGLADTVLRAKADGIIASRMAQAGEIVQAGAPVFVLAENGPRNAVFNVHEAAFVGRGADLPIEVSLVSSPQVKVPGRLVSVSPALDPRTGTVEVKVALEAPASQFPLGATVIGAIGSAVHESVELGANALWWDDGHPAVWLVREDSTVAIVPVEVLSYKTGTVVICGGLESGQRVVVEGTKLLTPGQLVEVIEGGE